MSDTPKASPEISPDTSAPTPAREQAAQPASPDATGAATAAATPQQQDGERKPGADDSTDAPDTPDSPDATGTTGTAGLAGTAATAQTGDAADTATSAPAASAPETAATPKVPDSQGPTGAQTATVTGVPAPASSASAMVAPDTAPATPVPPAPDATVPPGSSASSPPSPSSRSSGPPPAPPAPGRQVVRILLRALAALVLLVLLACGYAGYDAWRFLHTPPASPGADVYVDVEPGATFDRVTRQLVDKGAVSSDWRFKLLAHYHGWETSLKAGRFLVHSGWTPFRVLDQLVNGQPVLSRITLREGLTWWETARLLEVEGFVTVEDFRAVITDPAFLRHWGIPFDTAEGFLFPDTYLIKKPTTPDREAARAVAGRMVDTFWRRAAQVWPDGRPGRDELRRLVTLASIVEKETGQPSERGRVAGVYANRMRTGMLLQADPTTIYGLGDTFDGNLRRSHLQDATNPYNTYRRPGLPPGPICSPGLESLRAATTPEKHGYFYFVSRNDGSHQFSATLDEHNRAVNRYQRAGRARGGDQAATQGTPGTPANPAAPPETTPSADAMTPADVAATAPRSADTGTAAPASADTTAKAPEVQGKAVAPDAGDKAMVPAVGARAAQPGAPTASEAGPDTPGANATKPATQPATQPAPEAPGVPGTPGASGVTATEAPAAPQPAQSSQPLKASPGAKPAPTPLPRAAMPAGNGTTGATGANATAPTSAGVRAPTAPREVARPTPAHLEGTPAPVAPNQVDPTPAGRETPPANTQAAP